MERRFSNSELRALGNNKIGGTASVYYDGTAGSEYRLAKNMVERISPGAYDNALRSGKDVVALFNHDPNQPIGRLSNQTLRLWTDERGLQYEIDLPDTQSGRDLYKLVERGDVRGSSFGATDWFAIWQRDGDTDIRNVKRLGVLIDVSPVTFPAYGGTAVGLRSLDLQQLERERETWFRIEQARKLLRVE